MSFFQFSSNETSLHNFFSTAEERFSNLEALFKKQNEKINQLENSIKEQSKRNKEIENLQSELKNISNKNSEISNKAQENQENITKISNNVQMLKSELEKKLSLIEEKLTVKIEECDLNNSNDETNKELNDKINKLQTHIEDMMLQISESANSKIETISKTIENLQKNNEITDKVLNENKNRIELIKKSFVSLNTSSNNKATTAEESLNLTTQHINSQFSTLFDSLTSFKNDVNNKFLDFGKEITKSQSIVKPPENELENLSLRTDEINIDLKQPPILPKLYKFNKISEVVDYIYEFVPFLQKYLSSFFDSINLLANNKGKEFAEMKYELANIRSLMTNLATRDELNALMRRRILAPLDNDQGRCGSVRCIACGRELSGGYIDNEDYNPKRAMNLSRRFNVGIVENPRSARSCRNNSPIIRKVHAPK